MSNSTSFTKTPQAKDDSFYWTEDALLSSSLFDQGTNVVTLNVMANDLGGKAKKLWSIDNGDFLDDLITNNVNTGWESTANGNQIRIVNGQIELDISNALIAATGVDNVSALAAGVTIADSFTYAIQLGNGTLSYATVSFSLVGNNDGPVAIADTGSAGENETKSFDVLANDTDVDAGDTKTLDSLGAVTVTSANGTINGIDASGAFSIVGGQIKFTPGTMFDALDFDDTAIVVINYTMKDGQGAPSSSTLTLTVNGANDIATISEAAGGDHMVSKNGSPVLSFATPALYPIDGEYPSDVVVADVNGDGHLDILTANAISSTVSVLLNDGSGVFAAPIVNVVYGGDRSVDGVTVADVNGDGYADLVTADGNQEAVSVLLGNGTGAFGAAPHYSLGGTGFINRVVAADLDGDGKLDLVANGSNNAVSVLMNNGGGFEPAVIYAADITVPLNVAVADIDGDGDADIIVSGHSGSSPFAGSVAILLNDGLGVFGAPTVYDPAGNYPYGLAVTDVNGDGAVDIVTANNFSNTVSVFLNSGSGGFAAPAIFVTGDQAGDVGVADMNGDGIVDIVTSNYESQNVSVSLGDGSGGFGTPTTFAVNADVPHQLALGDLTGDGTIDIVTADLGPGSYDVSVLLNTSTPGVPGDPIASGVLNVSDADAGEAKFAFVEPADLEGVYGDFTFDSDTGAWTYLLDNLDPDTQALTALQTAYDSLTVTSFDGTAEHTITVSIYGTEIYLL